MTKMNDDQLRQAFFYGPVIAINGDALEWAKNRILHLETHACDLGNLLEQREEKLADFFSHLQERNATIDELEDKIKIYQLAVSQKNGSTSQESDEDQHQRHRRERMLDEVTLICVRDWIERMNADAAGEKTWGAFARYAADNICDGIDEYDTEQ